MAATGASQLQNRAMAKEKDVEMLRARVKHLALEEQRVRRRIDETKERTRQVKESKQRTRTLNAVAGDTNKQLGEHPSPLIARICIIEAIMSWNSLFSFIKPKYIVCYFDAYIFFGPLTG